MRRHLAIALAALVAFALAADAQPGAVKREREAEDQRKQGATVQQAPAKAPDQAGATAQPRPRDQKRVQERKAGAAQAEPVKTQARLRLRDGSCGRAPGDCPNEECPIRGDCLQQQERLRRRARDGSCPDGGQPSGRGRGRCRRAGRGMGWGCRR